MHLIFIFISFFFTNLHALLKIEFKFDVKWMGKSEHAENL